MFTTFDIEKFNPTGLKKLFAFIMKDKVSEDYIQVQNLLVHRIIYISCHSKINWDAVYTRAGYEAKCLVCNENIRFPYGMGMLRFSDNSFSKRMAENFAFSVLKAMPCPQKVKIAFYDVDGSEWGFVENLCRLTDNFIVVTANKEKYANVANLLMEDEGVSLVITNRLSRMKDCDLIIAPSRLNQKFDISSRAVIFTAEVPKCDVQAQCYYDYKVTLPNEYAPLTSAFVDELYIGSALYTIGKQYNLGGVVPTVAFNTTTTVTVKSMAKYLNKLA
ncbi:MAG: hypothetical protein IJV39_03835 [Ruminococcus sp.]|nr:hypothetical protein [Ruminococcus sp.]MBQ9673737.1 hypothetical protein [Ruminococcus sp.]